jgi:hypothetical protein
MPSAYFVIFVFKTLGRMLLARSWRKDAKVMKLMLWKLRSVDETGRNSTWRMRRSEGRQRHRNERKKS